MPSAPARVASQLGRKFVCDDEMEQNENAFSLSFLSYRK